MAPGERAARTPAHAIAIALVVIAGAGCVEVDKIPPGPLTVDDFEDGDTMPFSPRFGPWRCAIFLGASAQEDPDGGTPLDGSADAGPPSSPVACKAMFEGDRPNSRALAAELYIQDPSDGNRDRSGLEVFTSATGRPIDMSGFQRIRFSALIDANPATFPVPMVEVELRCGEAFLSYGFTLPVGADWARPPAPLADFTSSLAPRNPSCIREVDGIRFTVRPGLPDGETVQGTFWIDSVYLED